MRALTVRPPWSWAIAHGGKHVENRTGGINRWRYRGPLLIHAGATWSKRGATDQRMLDAWYRTVPGPFGLAQATRVAGHTVHESQRHPNPAHRIQLSAIVAVCHLADAHPATPGCCEPWGEQEYVAADGARRTEVVHLLLDGVRALPDDGVPWRRGALGLWKPPAHLVRHVAEAAA